MGKNNKGKSRKITQGIKPKRYDGQVQESKSPVKPSGGTSKVLFGIWILSVLFSLVPVYVYIIALFANTKDIKGFWATCLDCIVELDLLWVSATILIMAMVNFTINRLLAKKTTQKGLIWFFLGLLLAFILALTWAMFKYLITSDGPWGFAILGFVLIVFSLAVSTPLQTDSLENEA